MKEVTNEDQASLHLSEVPDGFPAYGFVDVEQRALPALETWMLGHFITQALQHSEDRTGWFSRRRSAQYRIPSSRSDVFR